MKMKLIAAVFLLLAGVAVAGCGELGAQNVKAAQPPTEEQVTVVVTPTPTGTPLPTATPGPKATAGVFVPPTKTPTGTPLPTATPGPKATAGVFVPPTKTPTGTPLPTASASPLIQEEWCIKPEVEYYTARIVQFSYVRHLKPQQMWGSVIMPHLDRIVDLDAEDAAWRIQYLWNLCARGFTVVSVDVGLQNPASYELDLENLTVIIYGDY